jgi:hypothetical protein
MQNNPLASIMGLLAPSSNPFQNQMSGLMALAQLLQGGNGMGLG